MEIQRLAGQFIPTWMAVKTKTKNELKQLTITRVGEDTGKSGTFIMLTSECNEAAAVENNLQSLRKLSLENDHRPVILCLGIYI